MDSREFIHILVEIRDIQRDHLAEYRRVTQEQLELSRLSGQRQERHVRLYKKVVSISALILLAMLFLHAWITGLIH